MKASSPQAPTTPPGDTLAISSREPRSSVTASGRNTAGGAPGHCSPLVLGPVSLCSCQSSNSGNSFPSCLECSSHVTHKANRPQQKPSSSAQLQHHTSNTLPGSSTFKLCPLSSMPAASTEPNSWLRGSAHPETQEDLAVTQTHQLCSFTTSLTDSEAESCRLPSAQQAAKLPRQSSLTRTCWRRCRYQGCSRACL